MAEGLPEAGRGGGAWKVTHDTLMPPREPGSPQPCPAAQAGSLPSPAAGLAPETPWAVCGAPQNAVGPGTRCAPTAKAGTEKFPSPLPRACPSTAPCSPTCTHREKGGGQHPHLAWGAHRALGGCGAHTHPGATYAWRSHALGTFGGPREGAHTGCMPGVGGGITHRPQGVLHG